MGVWGEEIERSSVGRKNWKEEGGEKRLSRATTDEEIRKSRVRKGDWKYDFLKKGFRGGM